MVSAAVAWEKKDNNNICANKHTENEKENKTEGNKKQKQKQKKKKRQGVKTQKKSEK